MAKILLNVELNFSQSTTQLNQLTKNISAVADAFNKFEPKKGLTSQLNALTKAINAVANSNAKNAKAAKDTATAEEKAAKAAKTRAQAEKALAEAEKSRKQAETEVARQATETAKQDTEAAKQVTERAKAEKELAAAEEKRAKAEKIRNDSSESESGSATTYDSITTSVASSIKSAAISGAINLARDAFDSIDETVVATENAIVEIKRVLREDIGDKEISDTLYGLAGRYGQTFENASQLAIKFAQSGKTWTESIQATEAALIALDVAELDVDQASSGLIALMAQYEIEASDLMLVIDKLNKTADHFPVTTEALVAGLSRTGSTAMQTNLTLDDTIATLTALSKSTGRSGETLGTALNALLNYSSKDSALNVFASLSDDMSALVEQYRAGAKSMLDVWRGVSEEMEHLSDAQADLLDSYFDTAEGSALKQELEAELGDIYNDMSGVYSTANTFRKNYFIALLNNMDTVGEVQAELAEAQGYSQKELQAYMDTSIAQTNQLVAKWQELANDSSWLTVKKTLTWIAEKALWLVEHTGGLRSLLLSIGTVVLPFIADAIVKIAKELKSMMSVMDMKSRTAGGWVAIIGAVISLLSILAGIIESIGDSSESVAESLTSNWEELRESTAEIAKLQHEHDELAAKTALSTEEAARFADVESQLITILGTKANVLATLTQGTEEYTQKLKQLAEEELKRRAEEAYTAAYKAENDYISGYTYNRDESVTGNDGVTYYFTTPPEEVSELFETYSYYRETGFWTKIKDALIPFSPSYNVYYTGEGQLPPTMLKKGLSAPQVYVAAQAVVDKLENTTSEDGVATKAAYASKAKEARTATEEYIQAQMESAFYNRILKDGYEGFDDKEYAEDFLNTFWNNRFGGIEGEELITEAFYDYAKGTLIELMDGVGAKGYVQETTTEQSKLNTTAQTFADLWAAAAENIKAARTELEEAATLEAKQNAILEAQLKLQEAIAEARQAYVKGVLEDYVDELEDAATLEEKQNAVIEARQKLLEAQHNRNVRVYNAKTGQWEWQANPSDINSAEDDLQNAVESLQDYLKNQAVKEIKELISSGNYSVSGIQSILDKWLGYTDGNSELETWADGLVSALSTAIKSGYYDVSKTETARSNLATAEEQLKSYWTEKLWDEIDGMLDGGVQSYYAYKTVLDKYAAYGVDQAIIDKILSLLPTAGLETGIYEQRKYTNGVTAKIYDSGGILEGMGGIKATADPETVLDPEITRKILSPDSNYRFETFAKSLGIMFETSRRMPSPQITQTAPVSNNSRTYTINGVPITEEAAQRYTVTELFDKMDLFDNDIQ